MVNGLDEQNGFVLVNGLGKLNGLVLLNLCSQIYVALRFDPGSLPRALVL